VPIPLLPTSVSTAQAPAEKAAPEEGVMFQLKIKTSQEQQKKSICVPMS
jgi:hypothetical protein